MESTGKSGRIQITEKLHSKLCGKYQFEKSSVVAKGKGEMTTYLLSTEYYQNTSPDAMPLDSTLKIRARAMGHPVGDEFSEHQSESGQQMEGTEDFNIKPSTPPPTSQTLNPVLATITKVSSLSSLTSAAEKEEKELVANANNNNNNSTPSLNVDPVAGSNNSTTTTGLDSILRRSRSLSVKVQQPVLLDLKNTENNNSGNLRRFSLPRSGSPISPVGSEIRNPFSPAKQTSNSNVTSNVTIPNNTTNEATETTEVSTTPPPSSSVLTNQHIELPLLPTTQSLSSNSQSRNSSRRASVSSECSSSSSGTLEIMNKPVLNGNIRRSIERQKIYDQETHRYSEQDSDDENKSVLEVHKLRRASQPYVNMDHHRHESNSSSSENHALKEEEKE